MQTGTVHAPHSVMNPICGSLRHHLACAATSTSSCSTSLSVKKSNGRFIVGAMARFGRTPFVGFHVIRLFATAVAFRASVPVIETVTNASGISLQLSLAYRSSRFFGTNEAFMPGHQIHKNAESPLCPTKCRCVSSLSDARGALTRTLADFSVLGYFCFQF